VGKPTIFAERLEILSLLEVIELKGSIHRVSFTLYSNRKVKFMIGLFSCTHSREMVCMKEDSGWIGAKVITLTLHVLEVSLQPLCIGITYEGEKFNFNPIRFKIEEGSRIFEEHAARHCLRFGNLLFSKKMFDMGLNWELEYVGEHLEFRFYVYAYSPEPFDLMICDSYSLNRTEDLRIANERLVRSGELEEGWNAIQVAINPEKFNLEFNDGSGRYYRMYLNRYDKYSTKDFRFNDCRDYHESTKRKILSTMMAMDAMIYGVMFEAHSC
jgi:hypothetical protein